MNIDVNELEVMEDIASLAVVTGEKKEKYLFWQLEISMAHAKRIDLIVSFLMESGVKMLFTQRHISSTQIKKAACLLVHQIFQEVR